MSEMTPDPDDAATQPEDEDPESFMGEEDADAPADTGRPPE